MQVFTITTRPEQEAAAEALVRGLSSGARLTYALAGTRKYELPAEEVSLAGGSGLGCGRQGAAAATEARGARGGAGADGTPLLPCTGLFKTMGEKRADLEVLDWGVHSATLEEVFIAFAESIGAEGGN
jgi:hypothetical protein